MLSSFNISLQSVSCPVGIQSPWPFCEVLAPQPLPYSLLKSLLCALMDLEPCSTTQWGGGSTNQPSIMEQALAALCPSAIEFSQNLKTELRFTGQPPHYKQNVLFILLLFGEGLWD